MGRPRYKRVEERGIDMIEPLDYLILGRLPEEGATLAGGFSPMGASAKALAKEFKGLDGNTIVSRLRVMHMVTYVKPVTILPASQGKGWQITAEGKKVLDAWRSQQQPN